MRLIDADSIHYTRVLSQQGLNMELAAKVVIDDMPTIDAAPVVHGRWEFRQNEEYSWCTDAICAACKNVIDSHVDNGLEYKQKKIKKRLRYCPNCGAKMDKEEPNE